MFTNREQAATLLAEKLKQYRGKDVLVFAIPRGAVGMGKIIAKSLSSPFDILVVRKIGAPQNSELAVGAAGPSGALYWDTSLCRAIGIDKKASDTLLNDKKREREEREKALRGDKPYPSLTGKTVIVVDDGVATGATARVAATFLRRGKAAMRILATPVIAKDTLIKMKSYFHKVIYLEAPKEFHAVGQFYEEFRQVTDQEVIKLLSIS